MVLMIFVINDVMVNSKVNKVADKILRQMPEVFTEIRHSFHEHGMIEEAFNDAIEELENKEIVEETVQETVEEVVEEVATKKPAEVVKKQKKGK